MIMANNTDYIGTYEMQLFVKVFVPVCFALIPLAVGGNLLVLVAIYKFPNLRIVPYIFVASLATSDLVVGLFSIPTYIGVLYLNGPTANKQWACTLAFASVLFPVATSMYSLIGVSVDRYMFIMKPLIYQRFMTEKVAGGVVVFIWVFLFLLALVSVMGYTNWTEHTTRCTLAAVWPFPYSFMIMSNVLVILAVTSGLYGRILYTAHKQRKTILAQTSGEQTRAAAFKKSGVRLAKMFLMVIGLFYALWTPYLVLISIRIVLNVNFLWLDLSAQCCTWLCFVNSCVNPFIYAAQNTQFREAFRKILRLCKNGTEPIGDQTASSVA